MHGRTEWWRKRLVAEDVNTDIGLSVAIGFGLESLFNVDVEVAFSPGLLF